MSESTVKPQDVSVDLADDGGMGSDDVRNQVAKKKGIPIIYKLVGGVAGVLALFIGAMMFSGDKDPEKNDSKVAAPSTDINSGAVTGIGASQEYNKLVDQHNKEALSDAKKNDESFLPKFNDGDRLCDDENLKKKLEEEARLRNEAIAKMNAMQAQLDALRRNQNKENEEKSMVLPYYKDAVTGQEYATPEHYNAVRSESLKQMTLLRDNILQPGTKIGAIQGPAYTPPVNPRDENGSGSKPKALAFKNMMAGTILYATLETAINSDVKAPVLAIVRGGDLDGARLIGQYKREFDFVVLEFSRGTFGKTPITLNGVAIDPSTTWAALASDVDHHYLLKVGAVAGAAFLQGYGQAVQLAGQQIEYVTVPGSLQTVPVQTNELTDKQIAAIALGQVGETLSDELKKAADRPTTVYVDSGSEIGILLTDHVQAGNPPNNAALASDVRSYQAQSGSSKASSGSMAVPSRGGP